MICVLKTEQNGGLDWKRDSEEGVSSVGLGSLGRLLRGDGTN